MNGGFKNKQSLINSVHRLKPFLWWKDVWEPDWVRSVLLGLTWDICRADPSVAWPSAYAPHSAFCSQVMIQPLLCLGWLFPLQLSFPAKKRKRLQELISIVELLLSGSKDGYRVYMHAQSFFDKHYEQKINIIYQNNNVGGNFCSKIISVNWCAEAHTVHLNILLYH